MKGGGGTGDPRENPLTNGIVRDPGRGLNPDHLVKRVRPSPQQLVRGPRSTDTELLIGACDLPTSQLVVPKFRGPTLRDHSPNAAFVGVRRSCPKLFILLAYKRAQKISFRATSPEHIWHSFTPLKSLPSAPLPRTRRQITQNSIPGKRSRETYQGKLPIACPVNLTLRAAPNLRKYEPLPGSHLICTVQDHDGNTARLARTSDKALGVRVHVARIAPSLLDLGVRQKTIIFRTHPARRERARATAEPTEGTMRQCRAANVCNHFQQEELPLAPHPIKNTGATAAERLARSPPTQANRVQSPAGSPDFRNWESCRTMRLFFGFSRGSPGPPPPPLHFGAAPYPLQSPSPALKTSLLRAAHISSLTSLVKNTDTLSRI
ncbi:hypothetical protein PR048_016741 [Dryococelus australis]|uniref:Uncharacterized protein n=1 Tax=Dryococelus australis TaxID=614101 RepID=A0ABQ9H7K0_9NEOP|nr:hypothetical protein PR048_016741 [Dryococelus australis]